jgi:aquaporin Z
MRSKALAAEFVGTFMLVASVLGAALFSFPVAGTLGVALSIGFTVMAMVFAVGAISGAHFNPAVTLGLVAAGRFPTGEAPGYIIVQCLGGIAAAVIFYFIAAGKNAGFDVGTFASNTYGGPNGYSLFSVFLIELLLTAFLVFIVVCATAERAPVGFAGIAVGLTLAAIHIMAIPVSNASVNPARSLATAVIALGQPLAQLWVFWVAPILGGILGGVFSRWLLEEWE